MQDKEQLKSEWRDCLWFYKPAGKSNNATFQGAKRPCRLLQEKSGRLKFSVIQRVWQYNNVILSEMIETVFLVNTVQTKLKNSNNK